MRRIEMPCGWGCGTLLGARAMRAHFAACPLRPVAKPDYPTVAEVHQFRRQNADIADALIRLGKTPLPKARLKATGTIAKEAKAMPLSERMRHMRSE